MKIVNNGNGGFKVEAPEGLAEKLMKFEENPMIAVMRKAGIHAIPATLNGVPVQGYIIDKEGNWWGSTKQPHFCPGPAAPLEPFCHRVTISITPDPEYYEKFAQQNPSTEE